jgi:DNA repair ATPase RecN
MPKVNTVKSARKDYPEYGIKKGDTYYWWSFNFGPTFKSKTYPKRSQLTRSDFLSQLWDLEDNLADRFSGLDNEDDIQAELDSLKDDIQNLLDETQEKYDNMPDQLRDSSDAGNTLQERIDGLENWISELDSVDVSIDVGKELDETLSKKEKRARKKFLNCEVAYDTITVEEEKQERIQEIINSITESSSGL